ncbi:hypothetical protein DPMN_150585 [Dreissena polymorpha]|uniref:Uncharacterized protein n=1 Tax=Dreissena polymorpha TaxID=45954 RepID=A0A9D4FG01_DREPO|nr:hypothetical protein DPMN_150585 [Dreissena polymorpha]
MGPGMMKAKLWRMNDFIRSQSRAILRHRKCYAEEQKELNEDAVFEYVLKVSPRDRKVCVHRVKEEFISDLKGENIDPDDNEAT